MRPIQQPTMKNTTTDQCKAAEKLWDLANVVTGFAIVQSIATTFEVAKGGLDGSLAGPAAHVAALGATALFAAFYITAIVWCYRKASQRDTSIDVSIWRSVTCGRVVAVLLFSLITFVAVCGHWAKPSPAQEPSTSAG
jgi:hypothetical protein